MEKKRFIFTVTEGHYPPYTDALYLDDDEINDMGGTPGVLAAMGDRFDAWKDRINNPILEPEQPEDPVIISPDIEKTEENTENLPIE